MAIELKIPNAGESINEVEIGHWLKAEGETVRLDESVVEVQTDKASMELPAPVSGILSKVLKKSGDIVHVGEVIALFEENGSQPQKVKSAAKPEATVPAQSAMKAASIIAPPVDMATSTTRLGPAARKAMREHQEEPARLQPAEMKAPVSGIAGGREEEIVPMTLMRRRIAERLVEAQHAAALLTTFNEIDMSAVAVLRKEYNPAFQEKYQIKLGFMSFFVKAAIEALKAVPQVNAEIRGTDIVYKNYYDIGVAVGSGKGLVVPVIRHAERMSFAEVEKTIADLGTRARDNKLKVEELTGGTFTISNGGIYGSLLSTPIINPPQSGILGMHAIQDRPIVQDGQIIIRPMMYVALTYDHRLVDGREAVTFLKRIKDLIETPARLLLEI